MDLFCRIISLENAAKFPFFVATYLKSCKEDRKRGSREGARKQERKTGRVRERGGEREEIQRKDKWIDG